jgi:mycothiol system anti-sigma-R factor
MSSGSVDLSEISCEEVLTEVEDYLHGELDPDRARVLASHLSTCSPCWERAEFARKLKDIVRVKCRSHTPEHLVVRIRETIRRETIRGPGDLPGATPGPGETQFL